MNFQTLLKSKILTAGLILGFSAIAFITFELYWQKHQVDTEIARLQQEADKYGTDNKELADLIKYLDTPEYQEKEAREKLNLKREGEQVVVLPESQATGEVAGTDVMVVSNPMKWFNYFFAN